MKPKWDDAVPVTMTGEIIDSSEAAETYLRRHWAELPERERATLYRRLIVAREGRGPHASVRDAFKALVSASAHHL